MNPLQIIAKGGVVDFHYKGYDRHRVQIEEWYFGVTDVHREPQMLLAAYDLDQKKRIIFATKGISSLVVEHYPSSN